MCVECLPRVCRACPSGRAFHVLPFANERVAAPRRLDANLVALPGLQPDLDQ